MKSRTSFSKLTTFKKNIFRFAPVWVLYLVGMVLVLMGQGGYSYDRFANNVLTDIIPGFGIFNILYAGLVGLVLFGDLYNTRMCYSLHSLPQRRESWLLSHLAAGMLFSLVPNMVASLFLMARLQAYWFLAFYWLLAMTLQFMFFFGIAAVSALLSGNRLAMLAIYAGFNFVSMLAYATVQYLYIPTITGVVANMADFSQFCPVVHLYEFDFLKFTAVDVPIPSLPNEFDVFYEFTGLADGWGYCAIIGVVGLAAMGVSVWLYRIRHLECAGDFIAFPKLKGIACVVMTVCVTLCFALLGEAFTGGEAMVIWLAVGLIVGFFGSLMLLERRIKVFRKQTLLGFGILVIVTALSFCAIGFDWFGIESWTPNADRVQSVTISNYRNYNSNYDYGYYGDRLKNTVDDPEDIEKIIQAHEDILARLDFRKNNPNANAHRVTLTYKMKSGRTIIRSYSAPADGVNYEIIMKYLYTRESVLGFTDAAEMAEKVSYMNINGIGMPEAAYVRLLQALEKDFDAGNIDYPKGNGEYYMEYAFIDVDRTTVYRTVTFSDKAENLMVAMKDPQLQMGYTDWEDFLADALVYFEGQVLTREEASRLLEAIRKDVEAGTLVANDYKAMDVLFVVDYDYRDASGYYYRSFNIHKHAENTINWIQEYLGIGNDIG